MPATSTLHLDNSTGGVPTACIDSQGSFAYFTNSSGFMFKVDAASLEPAAGPLSLQQQQLGRDFFCFLDSAGSTLYVVTQHSVLIQVDAAAMAVTAVRDYSAELPVGWAGGFAVLADTLYLTGKYNLVAVSLPDMAVRNASIPLPPGIYEPLCGDALPGVNNGPAGSIVIGAASGDRQAGSGAIYQLDSAGGIFHLAWLGSTYNWVFQVVTHPQDPTLVTFFTPRHVASIDLLTKQIIDVPLAADDAVLSELMCFTPDKRNAFVLSGSGTWFHYTIGGLAGPQLVKRLPLAVGGAHHSCAASAKRVFLAGSCADRDCVVAVDI